MYYVVFDVVKHQLTKCVRLKTKVKHLTFDLRFVTRRDLRKNGILGLVTWFKSIYWMISDLTIRFDLEFAHQWWSAWVNKGVPTVWWIFNVINDGNVIQWCADVNVGQQSSRIRLVIDDQTILSPCRGEQIALQQTRVIITVITKVNLKKVGSSILVGWA